MTPVPEPIRAVRVLLVEDNPADVDLIQETLEHSRVRIDMTVARDGVEAEAYLRHAGKYAESPRPDVVLLDLNLPRRSGAEVLAAIKADPVLRAIPIVILTSSDSELDVARSYADGANCYITKPVNLAGLQQVVATVEGFWFTIVRLPDSGEGP